MQGSLEGVTVINAAVTLPGPYCTLLLADLGAEVISIERPGTGDPIREADPRRFDAFNRNKKSVVLDLKNEKGREICYELVKTGDIFLEGFRPGVVKRLGIDYETLIRLNPRLIYCSISGYGQTGAYSQWPGHDLSYQGVAGVFSPFLDSEGGVPIGCLSLADLSSAMFATVAILAALRNQDKVGGGQYIDLSMTDCLVSWIGTIPSAYFEGVSGYDIREPAWGTFKAADDKYLSISIAYEDHFWRNLCQTLGWDDLAQLTQRERLQNRKELHRKLEQVLQHKPRDKWIQQLIEADVPCAAVNSLDEMLTDKQLNHRGLFSDSLNMEGKPVRTAVNPLKPSGMVTSHPVRAPRLGEHSEEILKRLGYSSEEIGDLVRKGITSVNPPDNK